MRSFEKKRFLLVLDDVWYGKNGNRHDDLQQILSPLNVAKAGSKILATSRTLDALLALGATRRIPIRDLDEGAFLNLFMHYALDFASIDERDRGEFQMIGAEIAKKAQAITSSCQNSGKTVMYKTKHGVLEEYSGSGPSGRDNGSSVVELPASR